MASSRLALAVLVAVCLGGGAAVQLCENYYDWTCPGAYTIVRRILVEAHKSDVRIYASLIRLHFHDCFVQGCDGSLLLDSTVSMTSEKFAIPNNKSARGFNVVDAAKAALEAVCPGVVSCADILALAAEISVELSGGPSWRVFLWRLDGKTSNITGANTEIPGPMDSLQVLKQRFNAVGLDDTDLVGLSGAHTFGRAQCLQFENRLYNFSGTNRPDPTLNSGYQAFLSRNCPRSSVPSSALNDLDPTTPNTFDKNYYTNLEVNRGLLQSDQELKSSPDGQTSTAPIVDRFARSQAAFFQSFAQSMIKMGNIRPLTNPAKGQVRSNCRRANAS